MTRGNLESVFHASLPFWGSLSDIEKESVIANLSKILGKRVELDARVDSGLIGCMRVMVDGLLIDGSIKKQLDEMKKGLRSIRLA
jgi:F-type H+-transporting ATPase subunit delta